MGDLARLLPGVPLRGRVGPRAVRERALSQWMADLCPDKVDVRRELLRWALRSDPVDLGWLRPLQHTEGPTYWSYWHTGEPTAPVIVRRCLQSQRAQGPHVLLDDETLGDYLALPGWFLDRRTQLGVVKFSNVLRLALLSAYGGTWADVTVLLTGPPPVPPGSGAFFAYTRPSDPMLVATWFLRAEPMHPLVVGWLELQLRFWRDHDELPDYFLMHLLFEVLVLVDPGMMERWLLVPSLDFGPPHALQERLREPYDAAGWAEVCALSAVHKLTFKVEPEDCAPDSYFERLAAGRC